jgi:UDP-glucose 4-epimerase
MAISNFVSRCLNGDPPVVYGDGEQTRDFTFIDDIVDANLALLRTDAADGEVLNVGSTDTITINDLADAVIRATDSDREPVHESAKAGDARHTHADVSKARELLGYEPTVDIYEGVERFVEWAEQYEQWYEPATVTA